MVLSLLKKYLDLHQERVDLRGCANTKSQDGTQATLQTTLYHAISRPTCPQRYRLMVVSASGKPGMVAL
jgi:hypothetical protein